MTEMEEFLRNDEPFMIRNEHLKNLPITMPDSRHSKTVRNGITHRALHGSVAMVRRKNRYGVDAKQRPPESGPALPACNQFRNHLLGSELASYYSS
jgi:hypothetical protein